MHANFPCEKCNCQVRYKNSFDEHIIGHQKPRKYNCTNCQLLVKIKRPHRKHEHRIQEDWNEDSEAMPAQKVYDMDRNLRDDDQHEDLQGALQPHVQEEDARQEVRRHPHGVQPPHHPRSQEMAQEEDGDKEKRRNRRTSSRWRRGLNPCRRTTPCPREPPLTREIRAGLRERKTL